MSLSARDCRDLMKAHAPLVAKVGGSGNERIYLGRPAQNALRPFIVIRRDSTTHRYGTAEAASYQRTIAVLTDTIVTTVVADDYELAEEINLLVRTAVETKSGSNTGAWLVDTDAMDDEEDLASGDNRFIDLATITWRVNRTAYPTVT